MHKLKAFLSLLRWPNLVFIALTQLLFYYCIIIPCFKPHDIAYLNNVQHLLIVIASVFIAAGGYIINDYFDVNIDLVNKPNKTYINKEFSRRNAIVFHFLLSFIGLTATAIVAYQIKYWWLIIFNFLSIILLVAYSISLKRKNFYGNFLIGIMVAYTIGVLFFIQNFIAGKQSYYSSAFAKITGAYLLFSFLTTLIREAVKDMEDIEGDRKAGCKTMPIVWGLRVTKMYTGVLILAMVTLLLAIAYYTYSTQSIYSSIFILVALIVPSLYTLLILRNAQNNKAFSKVSTFIKILMLIGILSMLLIPLLHL
jgi:4-hydroxybenzoate polyprenyltransferase